VVQSIEAPFILGIGGTASGGSSAERALAIALQEAQRLGARTMLIGGETLVSLPHYLVPSEAGPSVAAELVSAVRNAHGLILSSPAYHGTVSALVKNAIDHIEETARDQRIYLDGVPVGLIATAHGWQATGGTLATLRAIVHSLRGWPTPMGVAIKTTDGLFSDGGCSDPDVHRQLVLVGQQVFEFASERRMASSMR
jgi:FMN reductase